MLLQSCFRRYPTGSREPETDSDDEGPAPSASYATPVRATPISPAKSAPARQRLGGPASLSSTVPGRAVLRQVSHESAASQRPPLLSGLRAGSRLAGRGGVAPSDMGPGPSRPISTQSTGRVGPTRHASGASSSNDSIASSSSSHRSLLPSIPAGRAVTTSAADHQTGRALTTGTDLTRGGRRDKNGLCERCDKDHDTDRCPVFSKPRDNHPDALRRKPMEMGSGGGNFKLASARVVRQPGDGSCLFHSIAYGLGNTNASRLRRELAEWVEQHPDEHIAETPLRDWVKWDSGSTVREYARRMAVGGWGGGIEMAACARLKRVNVHVYEHIPGQSGYKRISCFDAPGGGSGAATVHVLYQGGVHFDALVPGSSWSTRL